MIGGDGNISSKLEQAADAWEKYLALEPKKPDDRVAGLMVRAYDQTGLNRPADAAAAQSMIGSLLSYLPAHCDELPPTMGLVGSGEPFRARGVQRHPRDLVGQL